MYIKKHRIFTYTLAIALLFSGVALPAAAEETSGIFRYLLEPVYHPIWNYEVENFLQSSHGEGLLEIRDDNGRAGMLDITGRLVIKPEYDRVGYLGNGYFGISQNGKDGLLDREGKIVLALQYDSIGPFSEGLARVRLDGKEGFIDPAGNVVIPLRYDAVESFSDGLARVRKGEKEGYIDKSGKEVVPIQYDWAERFCDGRSKVSRNGKEGFVDQTGIEVIPVEYDWIQGFIGNLSKAAKDGNMGFIDRTGVVIVPLRYDEVGYFTEGLAWVKKGGKYGFVDETGREISSPQYDKVWDFSEGLAMVYLQGKYGFVDKVGCEAIPVQFKAAYEFSEGLVCVWKDGKYGFIDKTGKEAIPFQYDSAGRFSNGRTRIKKNGLEVYIDKNGNELTTPQYEHIGEFSEGLAVVIRDGKFGYIDSTQREVIPIQFEATTLSAYTGEADFKDGLALVQQDWKFGYIDHTGKTIVPIQYDQIKPFSNGLAVVYKNGRCGLVNTSGTVVLPVIFEEIGVFNRDNVFVRLNNRVGIASTNGTMEIPDKYVDPGDSFILPTEQLCAVMDTDSMERVFSEFAATLSLDQKTFPNGIDRLTMFMEEAAARLLKGCIQGNHVSISQDQLSEFDKKAETVKAEAEKVLSDCGIHPGRDLFVTAILEAPQSDRTEINIQSSSANTVLDYVRVETPEYGIALPFETLKTNGSFTIVITKEPISAQSNADEINHGEAASNLNVPAETHNKNYQYHVSFSKPIEGNVKLLLPALPGETDYQTMLREDGTNAGGKYNPISGWMESWINTDGVYKIKENRKYFTDIEGKSDEMQLAINCLASKGIINGTSSEEFSPDAGITRAQVAALIVRMLQVMDENEDGGFIDVKREDWFFGAAGSAKKHGIMKGTGNQAFSPELFITKDQVVVLAMRVLKEKMRYKRWNYEEELFYSYFDGHEVPSWAKEDVALAIHENLFVMMYADQHLRTYEPMTRGDAAVLLYRLYQRLW